MPAAEFLPGSVMNFGTTMIFKNVGVGYFFVVVVSVARR